MFLYDFEKKFINIKKKENIYEVIMLHEQNNK